MNKITPLVDVLAAYGQGPAAITEASLSRVMGLAQQTGEGKGSFAVLTSWRAAKTDQENEANFKGLMAAVQAMGLGYRKLLGHWQECQDPNLPYNSCPPEMKKDTVEPSLFVTGISPEQAKTLSTKFEQDAWIYAGPETEGKVGLFFREGGHDILGEWNPGKLAQAYSQLYRRKKRKVFQNLKIDASDRPGFTFAMPESQQEDSFKLDFIELAPASQAEGYLYARYTGLRDGLLQSIQESRQKK